MSRCHFLLERIDRSRNMARYYVLSIETTLFGESALVREWGRIGSSCRRHTSICADDDAATIELERWLQSKLRRGYRERPSTGRNGVPLVSDCNGHF